MKPALFTSVAALAASATLALFVPCPVLAKDNPALPDTLLVKTAPAGALSVSKARATAKPGEAVVVRGKVGGRMTPLLDKAAIAVLADERAITACNDIPGDACTTPWDYCCETPEKLKKATATIQVRDEKGKVLRTSLRGLGEMKELSTLVVAGTVDAASSAEVLIINATSIQVEKP
jgi:hypothetical protein